MESAMEVVPAGGEAAPVHHVACAPGRRLHFSWGAGHCLHLLDCALPGAEASGGKDAPAPTATCLRWYRPSATMRKVGYDVQPLFEQLQEKRHIAGGGRSAEWAGEVGRYSAAVASAMGRADGLREPPEQVSLEALDSGTLVTDDVVVAWQRAVWELLELFFVQKGSTRDIVTEDIAQWTRRNWAVLGLVSEEMPAGSNPWAELRREAFEGAASSGGLESHPLYWPCLLRAVALGWMGMAEDLLSWHSAWRRAGLGDARAEGWQEQIEALEVVQTITRSIPHFCREGTADVTGRAFHALPEFLQYRDAWVRQCQAVLYAGEHQEMWDACAAASPTTASGLKELLMLLSGDEGVLRRAASSWLELFIAEVLHCYPHLKPQVEFKPLMDRCVELSAEGPSEPWGAHLRRLLEAAADCDPQTVMAALQAGPATTPWLLAHVPDLLSMGGARAQAMLYTPLEFHGCSQVEHYLLDYALSLMPYPATWRLATQYLAWCPAHGAPAMKLLLERLPVTVPGGDSPLAHKALAVCTYHGGPLAGTGASLCRAMGALAWQEGRLGAALHWLLAGHDGRRAGIAVRALVAEAEAALQNSSSDVAPVAGLAEVASLLQSQGTAFGSKGGAAAGGGSLCLEPQGRASLEFLLRYHQLYAALQTAAQSDKALDGTSPALHAAREALLALLQPGVAPRRLWPAIVFKAVPLLEATSPPLFSLEDTRLLQERLADVRLAQLGASKPAADDTMTMAVVRMALTRNLARAHITECSAAV
mmetsp:Transcript_42154/g.107793  ORF Transcript_42154/g.107793 Transcript_42154/m.107793 type:complete len:762 (-) Transcript_42154:164-2449(-)